MPKTATAAPGHKVMYVRVEVPVHATIASLARNLNLTLTTVASAVLGQALGHPSPHSKTVVRAVALARKAGRP